MSSAEATRRASESECPCFLFDPSEDDPLVCECGHALDEHEPAPGGHGGECTVVEVDALAQEIRAAIAASTWMCPHCRDHYGPDDEDRPPVCDMCKKAGRT